MKHRSRVAVSWVRRGCWLLALAMGCRAGAPSEYELKAAYLFNILRFVEPSGTAPRGDYLTLGTYSAGPIEQSLQGLQGSPIHGRKLRIRPVNNESELADCDVIFFGRMNGPAPRILTKAQAAGLLSIGNEAGFAAMGGMISLLVEGRRIVVEVNQATLASAGWRVSSHLLEVARIVKEQRQ